MQSHRSVHSASYAGGPSGFPRFLLFSTLHPTTAMTVTTTLFEQIDVDYIKAYKAKDSVRLTVLRLLKTAVKNRLVELKRPGGSLADEEMLDIIIKEGKQRQDSIDQFTAAGRTDLADKEAAELVILKEYLPKPLSAEELAALGFGHFSTGAVPHRCPVLSWHAILLESFRLGATALHRLTTPLGRLTGCAPHVLVRPLGGCVFVCA